MYAKDFFAGTDLPADPGLCFVLMPFAPAAVDRWSSIRATIANPPFNLLCRRADDIARPGHIMTDVLENISRARLIVADLTGQNPNVFYELGIAHTVKDAAQVVLLASEEEEIPFDLRHLRTVIYHGSSDQLRIGLSEVIRQLGVKQYHIDLQEGQSGTLPARLTGADRCLYEVDVDVNYLGEDGVKFEMQLTRYAAGSQPEKLPRDGYYLGSDHPSMNFRELEWALCYSRPDANTARFIIGRPQGWVEPT
jgi:hypothetical protein